MSDSRRAVEGPAGARRLVVPDVLRGVAILAMLIAHAAPFLPEAPWALRFIVGNINDVASPLFALVMGMSAQLVWNRSRRAGITYGQQVLRGLVLIVLGVWMATWGSWVVIVLSYLGVLLIVGMPMLLLRTRYLAMLAVVLVVASDPINVWARQQIWVYMHGDAMREIVSWIALGSTYRLTNLLPFFLLGALLLRHGFRRDGVLWSMLIIAPLAYLVRPIGERILGWRPIVSGSYADTLHDIGLVFAVYVAVILVATVSGERARRWWEVVFVPFRAWGQVALSLYLLHVGMIAVWASNSGRPTENAYGGWILVVPVVAALGWVWWRLIGTGPLEWALGRLTGRPRPWRAPH